MATQRTAWLTSPEAVEVARFIELRNQGKPSQALPPPNTQPHYVHHSKNARPIFTTDAITSLFTVSLIESHHQDEMGVLVV